MVTMVDSTELPYLYKIKEKSVRTGQENEINSMIYENHYNLFWDVWSFKQTRNVACFACFMKDDWVFRL